MRAWDSLVNVGSALTISRYSSSVPRHCFDSREARSCLITRSKSLTAVISRLLVRANAMENVQMRRKQVGQFLVDPHPYALEHNLTRRTVNAQPRVNPPREASCPQQ